MSQASQAADSREQAKPQAVTKAKWPRSNRFAKLWLHLANILRLTIKEMRSIRSDPIILVLVAFSFTVAVDAATGASTEATNLSVGIVDEDNSDLSRRIADGLTPPTFSRRCRSKRRKSTRDEFATFPFVIEIPQSFKRMFSLGGSFPFKSMSMPPRLPRPIMA